LLALLIGLLTSAGLLLRGSWDVWAQSALFIAASAGTAAWLLSRIVVGYVPLPPRRLLGWAALLAALSGVAAYTSPLQAYAVPAWRVTLLGLWVFCAMAAVGKDERALIDRAVRYAGWFLVLLAWYQYFHDASDRPSSALLNQNVFAGTILMLLPLAVEQRDWFLCSMLTICLWWAHSVGAWLGLAGALVLTRRSRESVGSYAGLAIGFVCAVLIYAKLQSPDVLHRWYWWRAAWGMAMDRPVSGFGPGTYAYVASSYFDPKHGLSALYAHQHFLEAAAENGWLYLAVWVAGLVYFLRRGAPHKRFGALAILIQALWDYPLSIPGNFWLFCYLAASTTPQTSRGLNVPYARKAPWAVLVCVLAVLACGWTARDWQADRLRAEAVDAHAAGAPAAESLALLERSNALSPHPEAERAEAELLLSEKPQTEASLRRAAEHLERAARLNPYRPSTWTALDRLYTALHEPARGALLLKEGARYCPVLREAAP
jgi:hypothetical protein